MTEGERDGAGGQLDEFEGDLEGVEETLDRLEGTAEALQPETNPSMMGSRSVEEVDPGTRWFEATVDHRVTGLLLADLRAELADFRQSAEEAGGEGARRVSAAEDRLDELDARHEAVGESLASIHAPIWHARFDDLIATVEETLAAHEPPVDWAAVEAALGADVADDGGPDGSSD